VGRAQDFNHRILPSRDIRQGSRGGGSPNRLRIRGCHLPRYRDTPPMSLLGPPPPSTFQEAFRPTRIGMAVLVFPIVEHSLYPQLRA